LGEASRTRNAVTKAIEEHRYNVPQPPSINLWNVYCDWYVELIKPILGGRDEAAKKETQASAAWVLDQILVLLHPFMPFVTEELWQQTATREHWLMEASWPSYKGLGDHKADKEIEWVIAIIFEIRSVRAEMNISGGLKIPCVLVGANKDSRRIASAWENEIIRLARLSSISFEDGCQRHRRRSPRGDQSHCRSGRPETLPRKRRGSKRAEKTGKRVPAIAGRLNNPGFAGTGAMC
jgi:valyl-tRNA synthetase